MPAVNPPQAVDSHAHVFSADAPAAAGARYRPAYGADLSRWRALWPAAGITHGVLVQPSFFGGDNREMLETLHSDPRHLRGVAVLSPLVDEATIARFHRGGVRAIRLNLRGVADFESFNTPKWRALFERVAAHGWHVEAFVDVGRIPDLAPLLEGTGVALVLDHFGALGRDARAQDAAFAAVARLSESREVWCKFSAPYRIEGDARALAKRWLEVVGPRHIVWGSDWPWTANEAGRDYGELHAELAHWAGEDVRSAILWDNPARLYQFD